MYGSLSETVDLDCLVSHQSGLAVSTVHGNAWRGGIIFACIEVRGRSTTVCIAGYESSRSMYVSPSRYGFFGVDTCRV